MEADGVVGCRWGGLRLLPGVKVQVRSVAERERQVYPHAVVTYTSSRWLGSSSRQHNTSTPTTRLVFTNSNEPNSHDEHRLRVRECRPCECANLLRVGRTARALALAPPRLASLLITPHFRRFCRPAARLGLSGTLDAEDPFLWPERQRAPLCDLFFAHGTSRSTPSGR